MLYAKPIRESSASRTYLTFKAHNLTDVDAILGAGWDKLVTVLDEGGYVRYDFSTATKLLNVFGELKKRYKGSLTRLYESSKDSRDLERRLKALGKGIGDTTISIFLREMRSIWKKADPKPTPIVKLAMERLGIKILKPSLRKED